MPDLNLSNDLLPTTDLQHWLADLGLLAAPLTPTTPYGPASQKAARIEVDRRTRGLATSSGWSDDRVRTALEQLFLQTHTRYDLTPIDGLAGTRTLYALELWHALQRDRTLAPTAIHFPSRKTVSPVRVTSLRQRDISNLYGPPATADCQALLTDLPFPLRMDGSLSRTASLPYSHPDVTPKITRIRCHKLLHASVRSILSSILARYGPEQIVKLGIDQYAGAFNARLMRGSTKTLSVHSWGAAIDLDAQRNTLHETARTARFARADYKPLLDIFYEHGWINLGRERNYDWQHFQAVSL